MFLLVWEPDPQGLKPAFLAALSGTAEAVPCPNLFMKPVLEDEGCFSFEGTEILVAAVGLEPTTYGL
jgi:hypothetical protein